MLEWTCTGLQLVEMNSIRCSITKTRTAFLHIGKAAGFSGVIDVRNARVSRPLYLSFFQLLFTACLSVCIPSSVVNTQDTLFWVIELEKEGKDTHQLDLL